jgi:hypothetical protein
MAEIDQPKCSFCGKTTGDLYEGWFRTQAAFNPWAKGTVSAGVIQLRISCKGCLKRAIEMGVACATELPISAEV